MFTLGALWTKSTHIIETNHSSDMPMPAAWAMFAESSVIPRTVFNFRFWINVKILAFLVATFPKLGIKVALRHLCHVVFMKKLTLITLFAKASQPVFTYHGLFPFGVSKGAQWPPVTHIPHEIFADSCTRLIHSREGKRLHTNLIVQLDLDLELQICHTCDDFFHFDAEKQQSAL